jgi:Glycosyl transferase family 2
MKYIKRIIINIRIFYNCTLLSIRKLLTGNNNKIIVHLYTLCWNEEKLLPFFLDYYTDFVDRIIMFDNYSTDDSEKIIKSYKNTKIIKYDSDNKINDILYLKIKNNAWKKSRGKADFVIVCDIDEFLYSENLLQNLKQLKKSSYTLIKPFGFQMMSESFPEYSKGIKLTDLIKTGYPDNKWLSKSILFDPNSLIEINYFPGCHECAPIGKVNFNHSDSFKFLHYKYLGFEYQIQRLRDMGTRLSEINIEKGWGTYYLENTTMEGLKELLKQTSAVI